MINLKDKRVLVTGARGFFGDFIDTALHLIGGVPGVYTPLSTDYDLRDKDAVIDMLRNYKPDIIIHAAAHCGGIGLNQQKPAELFYDNMLMGLHLIHESHKAGVEKFVQIGTVCEYPKYAQTPFNERELWNGYPEETNAPYGIAKKALLVQGMAYRAQYGFNVIHLLPANLYGPRDNFDPASSHVIPALIRKFAEAEKANIETVKVWGNGNATREFLYVEDAATAVVKATERYDKSDPLNIGVGAMECISIRELAHIIADKTGFTGHIEFEEDKPNGQPRRCLDVERAYKEIDFKSTTSLRTGLDKTIKWYYENIA